MGTGSARLSAKSTEPITSAYDPGCTRMRPLIALLAALLVAHGALGATLYRRLEIEPGTLNPILQTSIAEEVVLAGVSRNLLDIDEHLHLVGGLCDRWNAASDLLEYTFHLRNEATWEDGTPVTAHDAVVTLRLIADPLVPALRYATALESFREAREVDAKTFVVRFAKPYGLRLLAFHFGLLPARQYEHADVLRAPENRAPLANGPYRFAGWQTGEAITLVRNEHYWGPRAPFDRIVFRILRDQTQAYRALNRGLIDETRLTAEQARDATADAVFQACCRLLTVPDLSFLYIAYSQANPVFADARTRRALTMLLDRTAILTHLYGGAGRVLSGPWPTELSAHDPAIHPYPYDPAAAAVLLAQAGWQQTMDGLRKDGRSFRFDLLYTATSRASRQIAEISAAAWASAGIQCRPVAMEWAVLTQRLATGEFDAVLASWANDLNPDLFESWHSSQAAPHGMNSTRYMNPRVDALIMASRQEHDDARRLELFHQLHQVLHEDEPATWVGEVLEHYGINKRITGIVPSPIGLFRFWPGMADWCAPAGSDHRR